MKPDTASMWNTIPTRTAAGVWSVCAIGLAIGAGFIGIGLFAAAAIWIMKYLVHRFALGGEPTKEVTLNILLRQPDQTPEALCEAMKKFNMIIQETTMLSCTEQQMHFELEMKMMRRTTLSELKAMASEYGDVQSLRIVHES